MKKILSDLRLSTQNFGRISAISICGMLLALKVVLGFFTISVSNLLKIGFSFLPIAVSGMLFGPAVGMAMGAAGDILSYVVQPTGPFFPGFTLNAIISGFLYGVILYRRPVTLLRVFTAKASVTVLISLLLNPLWLSVLYGKAFTVVVASRFTTNLILLPIETILLYAVLKLLDKQYFFHSEGKSKIHR
jgi:ECF transporter S component (folate family)